MLLQKGFSKVIYASAENGSELIAETNNGPIYRVVHTGMVSADESLALRQLCGDFGGATGISPIVKLFQRVLLLCMNVKRGKTIFKGDDFTRERY